MNIQTYSSLIILKCDTGCVAGNSNINHLMYADDLVFFLHLTQGFLS